MTADRLVPTGATVGAAGVLSVVLLVGAGAEKAALFGAVYLTELVLTLDTALALYVLVRLFGLDASSRRRVVRTAVLAAIVARLALLPVGSVAASGAAWIAFPAGMGLLTSALLLAHADRARRSRMLEAETAGALHASRRRPWWLAAPRAMPVAVVVSAVLALDGSLAAWALTDDVFLATAGTVLATAALLDVGRLVDTHLAGRLHVRATLTLLLVFTSARLLDAGATEGEVGAALASVAAAVLFGVVVGQAARRSDGPLRRSGGDGVAADRG